MNLKLLFFINFTCIVLINSYKTLENGANNMWIEAGRMTGLLIQNCLYRASKESEKQFLLILQRCLKHKSLLALERTLSFDVIQLYEGIELVRNSERNFSKYDNRELRNGNDSKSDEGESDWKLQVIEKILKALETHNLKIHLNNCKEVNSEEGRRRRHGGMMPLMVFGMIALGMILIPMGFQFLAVLGGKALLLAKMALLLTSIQGLKKIATSNVNYGLYRTDPCKDIFQECFNPDDDFLAVVEVEDLMHSGHYDRQWPYAMDGYDNNGPEEYRDVYGEQNNPIYPENSRYVPMIRAKISS